MCHEPFDLELWTLAPSMLHFARDEDWRSTFLKKKETIAFRLLGALVDLLRPLRVPRNRFPPILPKHDLTTPSHTPF
jgi:hypothetical protein